MDNRKDSLVHRAKATCKAHRDAINAGAEHTTQFVNCRLSVVETFIDGLPTDLDRIEKYIEHLEKLAAIPKVLRCDYCGEYYTDGTVHCEACGRELARQRAERGTP